MKCGIINTEVFPFNRQLIGTLNELSQCPLINPNRTCMCIYSSGAAKQTPTFCIGFQPNWSTPAYVSGLYFFNLLLLLFRMFIQTFFMYSFQILYIHVYIYIHLSSTDFHVAESCKDELETELCAKYQSYCKKSEEFMVDNCRKTCNFCKMDWFGQKIMNTGEHMIKFL